MTTYAYQITLTDSEAITVQEALRCYRRLCEDKLAQGSKVPYLAHIGTIDELLRRLLADAHMTSTSSFCWPKTQD